MVRSRRHARLFVVVMIAAAGVLGAWLLLSPRPAPITPVAAPRENLREEGAPPSPQRELARAVADDGAPDASEAEAEPSPEIDDELAALSEIEPGCKAMVSSEPLCGEVVQIRLSIEPPDDGGTLSGLARLSWRQDGELSFTDWYLPARTFFARTCHAAVLEVVASDGSLARVLEPGALPHRDVVLARPAIRVTGRLVRAGRPQADVGVNCRGWGTHATTDASGRFELRCHTAGLPVLGLPWELVETKLVDAGTPAHEVELGELAVRRQPPIEPGKIGVAWDSDTSEPTVLTVLHGTPAERAGLRKGDVLLEVDGHAIASFEEGMRLIPGAPGSRLRLKVRRGADIFLVDLERQPDRDDER